MTTSHLRRQAPGDVRRAIALLRVSTEDQKLGPDAQRAAIRSWASREGIEIVAWHLEQGVSGATPLDHRAGLLAALDDLRSKRAGHLVVAKRDRLARDVMITAMIERIVERSGAKVSSADGTNATGPEGVLMRGMIDLFAQYERLLIGARTRSALAAKKARGERVGEIPYGYALADDGVHLVAERREQAVIARVRALRADGFTIRGIVAECDRRGLRSRSGRAFGKSQIERLVRRVELERVEPVRSAKSRRRVRAGDAAVGRRARRKEAA